MADPFDAFFRDPFGESVNYMVKSDPLKIAWKALPPGAPPSFKGAVGKFTMNAGVDRREATTNAADIAEVTISGTGNVKLSRGTPVDLPVDFETVYAEGHRQYQQGGGEDQRLQDLRVPADPAVPRDQNHQTGLVLLL